MWLHCPPSVSIPASTPNSLVISQEGFQEYLKHTGHIPQYIQITGEVPEKE